MSVAVPWKCIVLGASNELVAPYEYAWTSVHVGFRASCARRRAFLRYARPTLHSRRRKHTAKIKKQSRILLHIIWDWVGVAGI